MTPTPNTLPDDNAEATHWQQVAEQYQTVISDNATAHVQRMTDEDLLRYSEKNNTPTASREDVLRHMIQWGGFRGMLLAGGLTRHDSSLFRRLLDGIPPLPHVPPRNFGKSWFELFDEEGYFECSVRLFGPGRRKVDLSQKTWLLEINECLWACRSGSEAGMLLIDLAQQWRGTTTTERDRMWPDIRLLLARDISFEVCFGAWNDPFALMLSPCGEALDRLADLATPGTDDPFAWTRSEPEFPFRWLISR